MINSSNKYISLIKNMINSLKGGVGLGIILFFIIIAFLRTLLIKYPPLAVGVGMPNQPPSYQHPFGTTSLGQDVFSQFIVGGVIPIEIGVLVGIFTSLLVILIAIPSAYYSGNILGKLLTLITDIFLVIPTLPLIILLGVYLGPSLINQVLVLTLISWPFPARIVRAQVISLKEKEFILIDKVMGASDVRIMFSEILPNVMGLILSNTVLVIIFAILFQAAISFLGLGVPNQPSWGNMLYFAVQSGAIASGEWWWVLPPGVGITLVCLGFTLILLRIDEILNIEVV